MDPAAEKFNYEPLADVRELIHVDDVMEDEDLNLGKKIYLECLYVNLYCFFVFSRSKWSIDILYGVSE